MLKVKGLLCKIFVDDIVLRGCDWRDIFTCDNHRSHGFLQLSTTHTSQAELKLSTTDTWLLVSTTCISAQGSNHTVQNEQGCGVQLLSIRVRSESFRFRVWRTYRSLSRTTVYLSTLGVHQSQHFGYILPDCAAFHSPLQVLLQGPMVIQLFKILQKR